ncbi:Methylated-DNA--protein-cysteine methyltransferase, constitutive [Microbulbifer aggregans]|uniref:Methylated-DNA--protein-cysteine methyltransferase n=1 Tax=Microbulbifer aggregans TaxID=1769779 RepID=A0A1C9W8I0_9GAMM|nr:methylated-DNA--[protein]-cysteine S-methyltransferase [Microbulbifer aggregans]AOS97453.1 Methylated-DNA--protein-cysteine methyltransferase, constitutive [Microbulbifer aggregans]
MIAYEVYETELGQVVIAADEVGVTVLRFLTEGGSWKVSEGWERGQSELTDLAASQLAEYLAGKRRTFELPLNPNGTEFQQRVWQALLSIPYGETRSYREQAEALGNVKAIRAVARANGANPIAIVIPCHRVIGADGTLTGYAGGLDMKARLLSLEGARFVDQPSLI